MEKKKDVLYIDNDTTVIVEDATNGPGGAALTIATVSMQLYDADDVAVGSPVALSHDGSGTYSGHLPETLALVDRENYFLEITLDQSGINGAWRMPCVARYRT